MLGCKASRSLASKKDGEFRYATRLLAHERGRRLSQGKDSTPMKACERLLKSDGWKGTKYPLVPKPNVKKNNSSKNLALKDGRSKHPFSKQQEKVVIVSKRSSSVSVVKSSNTKRSVSVKKVSYSTSVFLSSDEDEEESDSDDEEGEEEKRKIYTRTRSTILKRTMSKTKANNNSKKEEKSSKRSKLGKSVKDKTPTSKKKVNVPSRELRPRFPYSATQEWPTARAHRMASLNALAKVHILYENEGRAPGENSNEGEDSCILELSDDELTFDDVKNIKESKSCTKEKNNNDVKSGSVEKSKKNIDIKPKVIKRGVKRKPSSDVEIIDTKLCKRMASLNAQAILAASYLEEKPKKEKIVKKIEKPLPSKSDVEIKEIILESSCNVEVIEKEKQAALVQLEKLPKEDQNQSENSSKDNKEQNVKEVTVTDEAKESVVKQNKAVVLSREKSESPEIVIETASKQCTTVPNENCVSSSRPVTSVNEVGVTKYTAVTKVQINTTKEMEIKEEGQAERKIERILEKDDVAITRMYHYQSNNSSQSYCLQMQTTYKPASRNFTPPPVSVNQRPDGHIPHVMGAVMPSHQSYYSYQNRSPILSSQSYPVSHGIGGMQPIMGVDHVGRHYGGSAFTVPHYGHPSPMSYPHPDYGYYQPAGPLIQPVHDSCMIHKPVPYHPQPQAHPQLHKPQPPAPAQAVVGSRDHYSSVDQCFPKCSVPGTSSLSKHDSSFQRGTTSSSSETSKPQSSHSSSGQPSHREGHQNFDHNELNSNKKSNQYNLSSRLQPTTSQSHLPPSSTHSRLSSVTTQNVYSARDNTDSYQCRNTQNYSSALRQTDYSPSRYQNHSRHLSSHSLKEPHSSSPPKVTYDGRQNKHLHEHDISRTRVPNHPSSGCYPDVHVSKPRSALLDTSVSQEIDNQKFISSSSSALKDFNEINKNIKSRDLQRHKYSYQSYLRPPSVVEVTDDCDSGDTKTYIELDVPKACPQEKIIVVEKSKSDIDEQRCIQKKEILQPITYSSSSDRPLIQPEVIEVKDSDNSNIHYVKDKISKVSSKDNFCSEENPDVMVIEVTKKKETSALIRRAKLHGKQRTFRDSENRPLVQYSKIKKDVNPLISHHQKDIFQPLVSLSRLVLPKKAENFSHGWSWKGDSVEKLVFLTNDDPPVRRKCYPAIHHTEGDVIQVRDCVLLRSGIQKTDVPFVAKVTALWENPIDGEMTMSLLWYYRPEHTEHGKTCNHMDDEIFASKHRDTNSVACIEDKCFVLTFGEYCRYRRQSKMLESGCQSSFSAVPRGDEYPRKDRLPSHSISPEMVFFCRKVYDFRQKRILKNPM